MLNTQALLAPTWVDGGPTWVGSYLGGRWSYLGGVLPGWGPTWVGSYLGGQLAPPEDEAQHAARQHGEHRQRQKAVPLQEVPEVAAEVHRHRLQEEALDALPQAPLLLLLLSGGEGAGLGWRLLPAG